MRVGGQGQGHTTFTGDALGLFRIIPLGKQKEGNVSWARWGTRRGRAQAAEPVIQTQAPWAEDLSLGPTHS